MSKRIMEYKSYLQSSKPEEYKKTLIRQWKNCAAFLREEVGFASTVAEQRKIIKSASKKKTIAILAFLLKNNLLTFFSYLAEKIDINLSYLVKEMNLGRVTIFLDSPIGPFSPINECVFRYINKHNFLLHAFLLAHGARLFNNKNLSLVDNIINFLKSDTDYKSVSNIYETPDFNLENAACDIIIYALENKLIAINEEVMEKGIWSFTKNNRMNKFRMRFLSNELEKKLDSWWWCSYYDKNLINTLQIWHIELKLLLKATSTPENLFAITNHRKKLFSISEQIPEIESLFNIKKLKDISFRIEELMERGIIDPDKIITPSLQRESVKPKSPREVLKELKEIVLPRLFDKDKKNNQGKSQTITIVPTDDLDLETAILPSTQTSFSPSSTSLHIPYSQQSDIEEKSRSLNHEPYMLPGLTSSGITNISMIEKTLAALTDEDQKNLKDSERKKIFRILSALNLGQVFKDVSELNELHGNDPIAKAEMKIIDENKTLMTYYDTLRLNFHQLFLSAIVISSGNVKADLGLTTLGTKGLGMAITQGVTQIGVTAIKQVPVASILGVTIESIINFSLERTKKINMEKVARVAQVRPGSSELLAQELARKITYGQQESILFSTESKQELSSIRRLGEDILKFFVAVKQSIQEKVIGRKLSMVERLAIDTVLNLIVLVFNDEFEELTTRQTVVDKALQLLEIKYNPPVFLLDESSSIAYTEIKQEVAAIPSLSYSTVQKCDEINLTEIKQQLALLQDKTENIDMRTKVVENKVLTESKYNTSSDIADGSQAQVLVSADQSVIPAIQQNSSISSLNDVIECLQGICSILGYEHQSTKEPLSSAVRAGLFGDEKQSNLKGWQLVNAARNGEWRKITSNLSKVDEIDSDMYKEILFLAAEAEQSELVMRILEKSGLSSNTKNSSNNTPLLHVAIQRGDMTLVKSLKKRRSFDETIRDNKHRTPREAARAAGHESIAATF